MRDRARGTDTAYNWGIFDFASADFVPRLVRGRMRYAMAPRPLAYELEAYRDAGREVWAQRLALAPEQRAALRDFLEWNARPENRFYRYDYYRDNCSTRVRDALDRAVGGALRAALESESTGTTYRWHTRRALRDVLPAYLGIQAVLGMRADREISAWEETFMPERLRIHLRGVEVDRPGGEPGPLVDAEWRVLPGVRTLPEAPPARLLPFLAVSVLLALGIALVARPAGRGHLPSRILLAVVGGAWSLLAGGVGTLVLAAWLLTDHVFWGWNENLLQASPVSLLLVVLLPLLFLRRRKASRTVVLAAAVATLSLLGFLIQPLPFFDQANGEILALALPLNLALAWAAREVSLGAPGGGLGGAGRVERG